MMTAISLEQANSAIAAALADAAARGLKPLTIPVVDAGGHLIALQRQGGSSTLRPKIAMAKACGALALGVSSRRIGEMAVERPTFVATVANLADQGLVAAAGGIIIVDASGLPIGAIGVTGDTSDHDEACALAGIAAAGLDAQR